MSAISVSAIGRYEEWRKPDWKGVVAYLERTASVRDIVIVDGYRYNAGGDSGRVEQMLSWYLPESHRELTIWKEVDVAIEIQAVAHEPREVYAVLFGGSVPEWLEDQQDDIVVVSFEDLLVLRLREPGPSALNNAMAILQAMPRFLASAEAKFDLYLALAELHRLAGNVQQADVYMKAALRSMPKAFDARGWRGAAYRRLTLESNEAPVNGTIEPPEGSGPSRQARYFTTTWSDPDGWTDLSACLFLIGSAPGMTDKVLLYYNVLRTKLYIWSDDDTGWLGGCAPGSSGALESNQGQVHCADTSVSRSGNTVTITWAIEFEPEFAGSHGLYLQCSDSYEQQTSWEKKGIWTVVPPGQ
jgi:hypothetical protein